MTPKTDLKNLTPDELVAFLAPLDKAAYRARQLLRWIYTHGVTDFGAMTDLSRRFREALAEIAFVSTLEPSATQVSADGTVKFQFTLDDGAKIESVIIPDDDRHTLCVSTQVGCALGCTFCYTGSLGLTRHLTAAEIVNQICAANAYLAARGRPRLTNLVYMGMGEPLHNYEATVKSIRIATAPEGLAFAPRRITVSTAGLVPQMERLLAETAVNLAVSLHGTTEEQRGRLMPINRRYPLAVLLDACRRLPRGRRQRLTFEYTLIAGVNDADADARRLAELLRGIRCKINLIAMNQHPASPFRAPSDARVRRFQEILQAAGFEAFLRTRRGDDIAAACGQLGERRPVALVGAGP
ncbi:MAG TPA: 23S rRNA (adenine(2503)-C(2))-methyltransferase RlmN [Thermodesulfobacteriota bacterium]|nr:23S rRNA (adenine(2503)-C(2))-methyltransferase RlmN [Thermodesulfobacteriota bacterium]